jgi:hypothetical protein
LALVSRGNSMTNLAMNNPFKALPAPALPARTVPL